MGDPIDNTLWKDLTPEHVDHFYKILAKRADYFDDLAYRTYIELSKYLFAANTGAAAGLFLVLRSPEWQRWHLIAFFLFCGGTFFVGFSYLVLASWSADLMDGWSRDMNAWGRNEITVRGMDANNRVRHKCWKKYSRGWGFGFRSVCLLRAD